MSLKSGNLPSSPNKLSDNCYGMKFDVLDNQLLRKRHPIAHFNRWVNMEVVCNHVRNAAFKPFKSVHTQATVLQSCQSKLLTTNVLKRCETKQLRTDFIDNLKVVLQKKKWRILWKWVNFRKFCGSSNSSTGSYTLVSAATTMLKIMQFNIRKYN